MALHHALRASSGLFNLSYITCDGSTSGATTYTFNTISLGDANTSREIFIIVNWTTTAARTLSSATIGGVTATIASQANGTTSGEGCIFASVPTGTTGTIVFTLSGAATRVHFSVFRVVNRINKGQTSTNNYANSSLSYTSPLTQSVVVPARGFSIGQYSANTDITGSVASSPFTLNAINTTVSSASNWGIIVSYKELTGAQQTVNQQLTWSSGTVGFRWGIYAFNG